MVNNQRSQDFFNLSSAISLIVSPSELNGSIPLTSSDSSFDSENYKNEFLIIALQLVL